MYKPTVSWGDDILNSRDINAIFAELESEWESLDDYLKEAQDDLKIFCHDNKIPTTESYEDFDYMVVEDEDIRKELVDLVEAVKTCELDIEDFDKEELETFRSVVSEGELYSSDWNGGEALILESYFQDYAKELAEDLGSISGKEEWPLNHIDWESAADDMKQDYSSIEVEGYTYYVRS